MLLGTEQVKIPEAEAAFEFAYSYVSRYIPSANYKNTAANLSVKGVISFENFIYLM
jgi:hypothetical protein